MISTRRRPTYTDWSRSFGRRCAAISLPKPKAGRRELRGERGCRLTIGRGWRPGCREHRHTRDSMRPTGWCWLDDAVPGHRCRHGSFGPAVGHRGGGCDRRRVRGRQEKASWLLLRHWSGWTLARCADGFVSEAMMSLPAILALIDAGELDGRIPSPSVETAILGQPKSHARRANSAKPRFSTMPWRRSTSVPYVI